MDRAKLDEYRRLHDQLQAAKEAIDALAGKTDEAPAQPVGEMKLRLIDQIMAAAHRFLEPHPPFDFSGFGTENATLSDVSLVLGQYLTCFNAFRARHVEHRHGRWFWRVEVDDGAGGKRVERIPVEELEEA